MRDQRKDEDRVEYLARVLHEYMNNYGFDETLYFDGADCDGLCLAEDLCAAVGIDPQVDDGWSWRKELEHLIDEK